MSEPTWKADPSKTRRHDQPILAPSIRDTDSGAQPAARFFDRHSCPKHPARFLVPISPVGYLVDFREVIRLGDHGLCKDVIDVVMEGAATFVVCGLPVARKGDAMAHGGEILEGSSNLIIGGPTFSVPKNIVIGGTKSFKTKAIRDLYFLSTTPSGQATLDRVAAHGKSVIIDSGEFSSAAPDSNEDLRARKPTGTRILYNPDRESDLAKGMNGEDIPIPPQVALAHELVHAVHFGEGQYAGTDFNEEAHTVGFGPPEAVKKRLKPSPTENDVRRDLKLPERGSYSAKPSTGTKSRNFRPGACSPG